MRVNRSNNSLTNITICETQLTIASLRVLGALDNVLSGEDGLIAVHGLDAQARLVHGHGGERVARAARALVAHRARERLAAHVAPVKGSWQRVGNHLHLFANWRRLRDAFCCC